MFPLAPTLVFNLIVVVVVVTLVWCVSLIKRDASIIDPMWGIGFVFVAWCSWWLNHPASLRTSLLAVLTTVWGVRLSLYLLWRNWGNDEDRRYRAMRELHGENFWWISLFSVFLLQAVLLWWVALPIQVVASAGENIPLNWLDALGSLLWLIGFVFESIGDWQLARFKRDPKNSGKVLDRGLWRYTRHPNYFGDFCVWWGLYLIAAGGGAWWTLLSPLLMSGLLLKVSGVTLLERTITERRPDYAAYIARTNAFFPGPRRAAGGNAEW